jgi:hypothetical protein
MAALHRQPLTLSVPALPQAQQRQLPDLRSAHLLLLLLLSLDWAQGRLGLSALLVE